MKKLYAIGDDDRERIEKILISAGYRFQGKSDCRRLYAKDDSCTDESLVMIITVYPPDVW